MSVNRDVREMLATGASRRDVRARCGAAGALYFDELTRTPGALAALADKHARSEQRRCARRRRLLALVERAPSQLALAVHSVDLTLFGLDLGGAA